MTETKLTYIHRGKNAEPLFVNGGYGNILIGTSGHGISLHLHLLPDEARSLAAALVAAADAIAMEAPKND